LHFIRNEGTLLPPKLGGRLSFADIRLVFGTRPEAIKLAPVARALAARDLAPTLIFTGQHAGLVPHEFGLSGFPAQKLDCPGEEDPHRHVRAVTAALLPKLGREPDLLIVQGDTSSALGAALAAFTAGVPVAHVEAGLRTHDPSSPWPEEEYRTAIDAHAQLLFAPTRGASANLQAERVSGEIHVTGNTSIDALLATQAAFAPPSLREGSPPRILVTCHRRESWSQGLQSIASALAVLAERGIAIDVILHPNWHVAGLMRRALSNRPGVSLIDPCGHEELIERMCAATLVMSDSGGIQEEAPALGVPLLVLRNKTERPEGIETGSARLIGTSSERIVDEVDKLLGNSPALLQMTGRSFPYGDGHASERIAAIIENWLRRSGASNALASSGTGARW
jgi:UDP-N-acetylglucosamine 2-epimerase (non-hydrolysing)